MPRGEVIGAAVVDGELLGEVIQRIKAAGGIETVGKRNTIVGLNTFHPNAPAGIPPDQSFEEISGRIGALLRLGSEETQAGELIYSGVWKQTQFRVGDAVSGRRLHIHLDPLAGTGHLRIGLWLVCVFLLDRGKQPQLPHDPEQAVRPPGLTGQGSHSPIPPGL